MRKVLNPLSKNHILVVNNSWGFLNSTKINFDTVGLVNCREFTPILTEFDSKRLFIRNCSREFVDSAVTSRFFPNLESVYLQSDSPDLNLRFKNIITDSRFSSDNSGIEESVFNYLFQNYDITTEIKDLEE